MDIKFPQEKDPFPSTMRNAVLACIISLLVGIFIGHGLGALFGTDDSVINTSTYADYMAAVRTMFTDADQLDSYMDTALNFYEMDGLKVYTSRDGDAALVSYDGAYQDASEMFGEDVQRSLKEMMNTEDALYGQETTGGGAIEGVRLWNISVKDNVVYYYLYYDDAGFIGIAYDHTESVLSAETDNILQLTQNQTGQTGQWYIIYDIED